MRQIEQTALAVIESPREQAEPRQQKSDIAGTDDDFEVGREARRVPELGNELLGRGDMLEHVEQQHIVEARQIERRHAAIEIVLDEAVERHVGLEREQVDPDHAAAFALQRLAHITAGAAEIEHARRRPHRVARKCVRIGKPSFGR